MKRIIKLQSLLPNSSHKLYTYQNSHLSSLSSKSSKLLHLNKTKESNFKGQTESSTLNSLFKEITDVLGADEVTPDKSPSGFSTTEETQLQNGVVGVESKVGAEGVCGNANLNDGLEGRAVAVDTQIGELNEIDVSPVVHEVTAIIRSEEERLSMEERLDSVEFQFEPDIVDKVLKRCFKVPHLAFRFFTWVKMKHGFCHTTQTYNTMLYIAGEAQEFYVVENLLEEMEKNMIKKDVKTWTILVLQYGNAKLIGKALFYFEKIRKSWCELDVEAYKIMIRALCRAGDGEIALELYKEMVERGMRLDVSLYKMLLNCLAKSGHVTAVGFVGDEMRRVSQVPERDARICILKAFCVAGRIREALEFIHDLKDKEIPLDYDYFETLVRGLCRADRITDALEIVEIMKRKYVVDGKVYGIIINGYLRMKELSKALDLFNNTKEWGHLPTTSTYTELMQHLFRSKEYEKGCELYNEMLRRGIEMDSVAIMAVVAGHVRENNISEAWDAFKSMEDKGTKPTWKSYSIFVKELCKTSRTDEIFKVLDKMQASEIFIGNEIFKWVISCMERKGEMENVKKVRQMRSISGFRSPENEVVCSNIAKEDVHTKLNLSKSEQGRMDHHFLEPLSKGYNQEDLQEISCMEKKGEMENVMKARRMRNTCGFHPPENEVVCSDITKEDVHTVLNHHKSEQGRMDHHLVKKLSKGYNQEDLQEICRILSFSRDWCITQEALEKCRIQLTPELVVEILRSCSMHGNAALQFFSWVGKQTGYHHTTESYNMAMKISGRGKDFKHMRSLFHEMRRKGCLVTPDTWAILIMQYGRTGLTEIALKIFAEMKANGCNPTYSTYKYLIICLCGKKGMKIDEAIKLFREMICGGHIPEKELVETYLCCLCERGSLLEARRCIDSLCKVGFTIPLSYSLYVRALCRAGKVEEALSLVDEVKQDRSTLDRYTYGSLVHGLLRKGRVEEALAKVDSLKQAGIHPTVHVYTSFIVHFFKEKQAEQALEIFDKMQQEGCKPTIVTYSALIRGYMSAGKVDDAWNVFHDLKLKGPRPDFKTYSMFISCLCQSKKSEQALHLVSEMVENGIIPSTVNFRTVFFGLNREGKQDLAHTVLQKKWALISKRKFLTY